MTTEIEKITSEEQSIITLIGKKQKQVTLNKGDKIASTGALQMTLTSTVLEVQILVLDALASDNYTQSYEKRVNYYVKNERTGKIATQGTMYYSTDTDYLKKYVSYSKDLDAQHVWDNLRLYLESPTGKTKAIGGMTIRPVN